MRESASPLHLRERHATPAEVTTSGEPTPECPRPVTLRTYNRVLAKPEPMLMRGDTMLANDEAIPYDQEAFLGRAGAILSASRPILVRPGNC